MILGIGTDIIKTARFERATESFMARVFTQDERAYILKKGHVTAAGIFAAKEAVAKALGTGFRDFWTSHIEITHDSMGKPGVVLHGNARVFARKLAGRGRRSGYVVSVSISHTDTDAVAFAVITAKYSRRY